MKTKNEKNSHSNRIEINGNTFENMHQKDKKKKKRKKEKRSLKGKLVKSKHNCL